MRLLHLLAITIGFIVAQSYRIQFDGISEALFHDLNLYSQYSSAAYCHKNTHYDSKDMDHAVVCAPENGTCSLLDPADASVVASITHRGASRTYGYIAVDHTERAIVVAIQGTVPDHLISVMTDLNFIRVPTSLCKGCKVHHGFVQGWHDVRSRAFEAVDDATAQYPHYKLVVTGHSYGGAVAALLATQFRNKGRITHLYTYGMPHIGGKKIADYITSQSPEWGVTYRVTNYNDIVPMIPEHFAVFGENWYHFEPEAWISVPVGYPAAIVAKDVKILTEDLYGVEAAGVGNGAFNTENFLADLFSGRPAHSRYFGPMAECDPDHDVWSY